ncbi:zinc finger protein 845-like [Diabrotica virgifera virgifera]|uniref:Zinc finger protein 845-like n=1 Tax=Diabrotica virgifera virgifera TaxID=50390 RepID=A0A6P7F4T5_DIAVI|nr:zinc finger protein 845-like [Diabrotica virgifera virgifera]
MPLQTQMVTSKTAPRAPKVIPSQNQLLIKTKTSSVIPKIRMPSNIKIMMPSNTVGSGSPTSLKAIPTKYLLNPPTTLSNVHSNTPVVTQSECASPTYVNPFDYTPEVKNTSSSIGTQKVADAVKKDQNIKQEKPFAWACKICKQEFHEKELLLEHYEMHKNTTDQLGDIDENNDAYNTGSKDISCPICMTTYDTIDSYQNHVARKHKPKDHSCGTCKHTFTDEFDLSIHNTKHNQDPELYECVICKEFQTKDTKILYEHISKEHVKEKMYCNECNKTFLSKTWFKDHKIFHVGINKRDTYECGRCDSKFTSNFSLMEHMQEAHIKYKCNECDVTFPYKLNLDRHNSHVHLKERPFLCNDCGKTFPKLENLRSHEIVHKAARYVCFVCGKIFKKKEGFDLHMRVHTGEKPHKCNICGKAFRTKTGCNTHQKQVHGEGPWRVNTKERRYPCSECNKSFYNTHILTQHKRVHTGEKPFSCSVCKKPFAQVSALKVHERIHTGERPYPCSVCKKSFIDNAAIVRHMRVHTGEKPYSCSICKKAFSQSTALHEHMRIHTGERSYPCSKCKKKFITKAVKDKHEKKCM